MASITYAYMYWDNKQKQQKNPKAEIPQINLMTPAIVGGLTFIIAYSMFGFGNRTDEVGHVLQQSGEPNQIGRSQSGGFQSGGLQSGGFQTVKLIDNKSILGKSRMSDRLTESFDSNTYHLIGKNAIKLPSADVFIDIAKFN